MAQAQARPNIQENWGGQTWSGDINWPVAKDSTVYDLAVRLETGMTKHAAHPPFAYSLVSKHSQHTYPGGIGTASEMIAMGTHVGTHIDAPGHVSVDGCILGGREVEGNEHAHSGLAAGSVEEIRPVLGPGHLVDGEKIFGRLMTNEDGFGVEELEEWFSRHRAPEPGSIVLFRTGQMRYWDDPNRYLGKDIGLPGVKLEGARWLAERGVIALGSDTVQFEHKPEWAKPAMSVHAFLLVERGIPIMESLNLEVLAQDGARDFFFSASPLRIGGGTGSPIRPFAIVPRSTAQNS